MQQMCSTSPAFASQGETGHEAHVLRGVREALGLLVVLQRWRRGSCCCSRPDHWQMPRSLADATGPVSSRARLRFVCWPEDACLCTASVEARQLGPFVALRQSIRTKLLPTAVLGPVRPFGDNGRVRCCRLEPLESELGGYHVKQAHVFKLSLTRCRRAVAGCRCERHDPICAGADKKGPRVPCGFREDYPQLLVVHVHEPGGRVQESARAHVVNCEL